MHWHIKKKAEIDSSKNRKKNNEQRKNMCGIGMLFTRNIYFAFEDVSQ